MHCAADHDAKTMRQLFVWNQNRQDTDRACDYGCECVDCRRRMRRVDLRDVRRAVHCDLHGYSAEVRHMAATYSQIAQDRIEVRGATMRLKQIAQIGDRVTSTIEAERAERLEQEASRGR